MASFQDAGAFISGTSLVGQVLASYEELAAALGAPHHEGSGLDRITTQWCIRTRAGILTIYDRSEWNGTRPQGAFWWDIGGHPDGHADKALHPVVALVHELTGCQIRDRRPPHNRPDGTLPGLGVS